MLKRMQSPALLLVSLILSLVATAPSLLCSSSRLVLGSIQFPATVERVPSLRVYYAGHQIPVEIQQETKQITFSIPRSPNQNKFYMLISQSVNFASLSNYHPAITHNTVEYCRVAKDSPYKLFELELVEESHSNENILTAPASQVKKENASYRWIINEHKLVHDDLRMPDMTVIVLYNPDFVETLRAGSGFELPTIALRPDLLSVVGSESKLHAFSHELLMSAIDLDTVHTVLAQTIKVDNQRTLIAPPVT